MRIRVVVCAAAATLALVVSAPAGAQTYDSVGTRAQGMAGAFVAVADDATATWWNPAGVAGGALFSGIVEGGRADDPRAMTPGVPADRTETLGVAFAYPALGLSYYRLRISEMDGNSPTAAAGAGRQDQGPADVRLRSLLLQQFGVTVGQSLGGHLVLASTLKLMRGSVGADVRPAAAASIGAAEELDGPAATHADLDLGAMASFGRVRLGLAVRNLSETSFGEGADAMTVSRQARAGVAFSTLRGGTDEGLTVAADVDLTRTPTATGDVRHVAGGVEGWLFGRRLGLRGGVSANTVGERRPAASAGASIGLKAGASIDGALTRGADTAQSGWQIGLRVTF